MYRAVMDVRQAKGSALWALGQRSFIRVTPRPYCQALCFRQPDAKSRGCAYDYDSPLTLTIARRLCLRFVSLFVACIYLPSPPYLCRSLRCRDIFLSAPKNICWPPHLQHGEALSRP